MRYLFLKITLSFNYHLHQITYISSLIRVKNFFMSEVTLSQFYFIKTDILHIFHSLNILSQWLLIFIFIVKIPTLPRIWFSINVTHLYFGRWFIINLIISLLIVGWGIFSIELKMRSFQFILQLLNTSLNISFVLAYWTV